MSAPFSIDVQWRSASNGTDEVRLTGADLAIRLGECVATRAVDDWSKSVGDSIYVSAYPLALWFAASWWRLRWEPASEESRSVSWRSTHDCAAAGHGFIWPRIHFETDGDGVDVQCRPTKGGLAEPLHYLSDFQTRIAIRDFERTIDDFISLVLSRLDSQGVHDTDLHATWADVMAERSNPDEARQRRIEARLGFDPDHIPAQLLQQVLDLDSVAGEAAAAELTPACAGANPEEKLARLLQAARSENGIAARFAASPAIIATMNSAAFQSARPWEKGWQLARSARKGWNLGSTVSAKKFAEILDLPVRQLTDGPRAGRDLAAGLAIREGGGNRRSLLLRRSNPRGRMFEAARLLVDDFYAPEADLWLPATSTKTVRQKIQRAFAAELFCPIDALEDFLGDDYSAERCEEAAEHFGVGSLTIRSHLANNHLIAVEDIHH